MEESQKKVGFALLDAERRAAIASAGGRRSQELGRAHRFDADEARRAGRLGGQAVSEDRDHMAEIGRRGGRAVSEDRDHMAEIGRRGGRAASADRDHMVEIGRRGRSVRAVSHQTDK